MSTMPIDISQAGVKRSWNSDAGRSKRCRVAASSKIRNASTPASMNASPLANDRIRLTTAITVASHQAASRRRNRPRATNSSRTPSTLPSNCELSTTHSGSVVARIAKRPPKAGVAPETSNITPMANLMTPRNIGAS